MLKDKWCLITSLDDYSRLLLYARLVERELSWHHIRALQDVFLTRGAFLSPTTWILTLSFASCKEEIVCGGSIIL